MRWNGGEIILLGLMLGEERIGPQLVVMGLGLLCGRHGFGGSLCVIM